MNQGKKHFRVRFSLVTKVCLKTIPGDAVVQMGWQMEISPTGAGRGVFVDVLVHVEQRRGSKGEAAITVYYLFLVNGG